MKNKRQIKKTIKKVDEFIKKTLSSDRYEHSVRVAKCAKYLAKVYGETKKTSELAFLAGLAHDICKELSNNEQMKIAKKSGEPISDIGRTSPNLLHGITGAYVLQKDFKIKNAKVLQAVRQHTFGAPNLCNVAKLVFIADKIEPERKESEYFRKIVGKVSLNELALKVLEFSIKKVEAKGAVISPATLGMKEELKYRVSVAKY